MSQVEAIERATVAAVSPAAVAELDGWLVALDPGTIGRAHSAVPLRHDVSADALDAIEALYAERGLSPVWRIADLGGLAPVRAALAARGYEPTLPTLAKTGTMRAMLDAGRGEPAELVARPDGDWAAVFCGEGFDPADGANRVAAFTRTPDAIYGRVRDAAGRTTAVGVMTFLEDWAGIHGMRTAADRRGEGAAGRILATMAAEARRRGVEQVFLQVTEDNPARSMYRRFGFRLAWRYHYWRKAGA